MLSLFNVIVFLSFYSIVHYDGGICNEKTKTRNWFKQLLIMGNWLCKVEQVFLSKLEKDDSLWSSNLRLIRIPHGYAREKHVTWQRGSKKVMDRQIDDG